MTTLLAVTELGLVSEADFNRIVDQVKMTAPSKPMASRTPDCGVS